jgi:CBS domain-containing membrane protein
MPGTDGARTGERRLAAWLRSFVPARPTVSRREIVISGVGAWIGLFLAFVLARQALGTTNVWFVAPMGASAVLLFAVPSSPLAQPWSIIGGNLVAATIGVTCAAWIPDPGIAAAAAGALAIMAMFALRCLHPPSGAVALTAVLGGPAVAKLGYGFVLWPVGVDSVLLLLAALAFNAAVRRRYPHGAVPHAHPHGTRDEPPSARLGPTARDVDEALKQRGELLDISPEDIEELVAEAERRAYARRFGDVRCEDIMSRDVVTVKPTTSTQLAWSLMLKHRVKALPVVDNEGNGTLVGIVTMHDFFVGYAAARDIGQGADATVRRMMTTQVVTARPEQAIVELITAFSDGGRHHMPVIDARHKLVGMVTQSDMIAALYRMGLEARADRPGAAVTMPAVETA